MQTLIVFFLRLEKGLKEAYISFKLIPDLFPVCLQNNELKKFLDFFIICLQQRQIGMVNYLLVGGYKLGLKKAQTNALFHIMEGVHKYFSIEHIDRKWDKNVEELNQYFLEPEFEEIELTNKLLNLIYLLLKRKKNIQNNILYLMTQRVFIEYEKIEKIHQGCKIDFQDLNYMWKL